MTRKECLDNAAECVLQDRVSQYGRPEDNFGRIAKLWSTYTGTVLDGIDVAMMMSLLKVARIRNNKGYEDGYIDLAGYAACGAELAGAEKAREDATRRWGEEYKKLREQAEGGCCQNGKDHAMPEFKQGEAVEWNSADSGWRPAVYLREAGDPGYCLVQEHDGSKIIVGKSSLRRPEANYPENPDSSPEFQRGDKVQCRVELPSVSDRIWVDGEYVRYEKGRSRPHVVFTRAALELVGDEDIRPAPEAEGCEELVQDEESDVERVFGTLKKRPAPEYDAPQTPRELYDRIIANNPATFGDHFRESTKMVPHNPIGEELAEMAEEEKRG